MTWRLVRAELRKLSTTKLPWGFLAVLVVISTITAFAVIFGTDADGSKGFIATTEDQRSLLAFGKNALMGAGLFGAIAVAREYSHNTVVPMFLTAPRRNRAMLAQLLAVLLAGGVLGFVGGALIVAAGALSIPLADQEVLLSFGDVTRLIVTSAFAGAIGAVLGGGVGAVVRNTGGAVTAAVLVLIILPPLIVQLVSEAGSWVPSTLVDAISGVDVGGPGLLAALAALLVWGLVPALVGVGAVQRRDVI